MLGARACRKSGVLAALCPADARAVRVRNALRNMLRIMAFAMAVTAAAGPALPARPSPRGPAAHVVFVLDVSASMLAQDVGANRVTEAKKALRRIAALLPGDVLGLIAASGAPVVACPPTTDREAFAFLLDHLDSASVSDTGTQLAPALRMACGMLARAGAASGAVIVLTDGEDYGPSLDDIAAEARYNGFVVHGVCIGGTAGAQIMKPDFAGRVRPVVGPGGQRVISRADPQAMRRWARAGGGSLWTIAPSGAVLPDRRQQIVPSRAGPAGRGGTALTLIPFVAAAAACLLLLDALMGLRYRDPMARP